MLRTGTLGESQRPRAMEAIRSNAKRQAKSIDDLLDVSRIVSGKMEVSRTAVDLGEVVRAALQAVQSSADTKRLQLHTDLDGSLGTVFGDAFRLQQILSNLLTNAVKFTADFGAIRSIVRRTDEFVEIVVSDNGRGISPDFLPWVFEPFRQADGSTTRAYGGLGLGLSIVRSLVEAHRGTVTAHSAGEGHGATFTVRLPIVAAYAEQDKRSVESLTAHAAHDRHPLEGVSVLVVDDAPESREVVTVFLQNAGASVFSADSATEALDVLQREPVDVLLADIAMPVKGYALLQEVRTLPLSSKARVPAAALTSFPEVGHQKRARQAGFQMHLAKPVASEALVDAVARFAGLLDEVGGQIATVDDHDQRLITTQPFD